MFFNYRLVPGAKIGGANMSIQIVTDSTCDLSKNLVEKFKIEVVPLIVNFGEESFSDGVEISSEEFFKKLRMTTELPFTSQVNPAQFEAVFKKILNKGDEVVGIFISSTFSGTYNSAIIAKESFSDKEKSRIHLFDSKTSTVQLGLIALEAAKVAKSSNNIEMVRQKIQYAIGHSKVIFMMDTLLYLSKGGRLSPGQAMIGNLLNVKPILTVNDEAEITTMDKVRGRKKGVRWLVDWVEQKGLKLNEIPFALIHGDDLGNLELLKEQLGDHYTERDEYELCLGAVIGTHLGPGCVGLAYIE